MATPGRLIEVMADALGVPAATITQYDRVLAENGLRSKGGRGLSAARVIADDAAHLLIAIMASPVSGAAIKDAAKVCRLFGALPNRRGRPGRDLQFRGYGLSRLAELPTKHSFHDALTILIKGANTEKFMAWDDTDSRDYLLQVHVAGPSPHA